MKIQQEIELMQSGTLRWCSGHLEAVPVSEFDDDGNYCRKCAAVLQEVKDDKKTDEPVRWSPGGNVCIIDGQGYRVNEQGRTVCVGPVDESGKTRPADGAPTHVLSPSDEQDGVAKISDVESCMVNDSQIQNDELCNIKKRRGRPVKDGKVHRITKWRRGKQGVMMF